MIRYLVLPALLLAMTTSAFAFSDEELQNALVGTWGAVADCSGPVLVFNTDGTFVRRSSPDADGTKGTYQIKDGKLSGATDAGDQMPEATLVYDGTTMSFKEGSTTNQLFACPK